MRDAPLKKVLRYLRISNMINGLLGAGAGVVCILAAGNDFTASIMACYLM
jgi:hypothetical protein